MGNTKDALVALRDAANSASSEERPDLRVIAEKFEAFRTAWATDKAAELKAESDPDSVSDEDTEDESGEEPEAKTPPAKATPAKK